LKITKCRKWAWSLSFEAERREPSGELLKNKIKTVGLAP